MNKIETIDLIAGSIWNSRPGTNCEWKKVKNEKCKEIWRNVAMNLLKEYKIIPRREKNKRTLLSADDVKYFISRLEKILDLLRVDELDTAVVKILADIALLEGIIEDDK